MKIAIITGATGGLGKWFAYYANVFATDIDEIWLIGRNQEKLTQLAKHLKLPVRQIVMDLTDEMQDISLTQLLLTHRPQIRLLVNNAGCGMIGPFAGVGLADHTETIRLNCNAFTRMIYYCLPFMNKNSHVVNVASAAAFFPQKDFAVYAASKSYVLRLSRALSKELKHRKIYVTAVCPGAVMTGFFEHAEKYQKRKAYKNLFLYDARKVVRKAYRDAYSGKKISIIGFWMKLLAAASRLCPFNL